MMRHARNPPKEAPGDAGGLFMVFGLVRPKTVYNLRTPVFSP